MSPVGTQQIVYQSHLDLTHCESDLELTIYQHHLNV